MLVFGNPNYQNFPNHPKLDELIQLINGARNGESNEEDLVMDEPQNVVFKCPITRKAMENPIKNTLCDHVYEKNAIMNYVKSKPNPKKYVKFSRKQKSLNQFRV